MAAHKGNQYHLKYTLPIALELFEKAKDILVSDPDIITETELMVRCKYELLLPMSSYEYLRTTKFPKELRNIKREIEAILESRVMKSKEMYPGIAAMTLKNKHGWKDQQDIKQTTEVTIKTASDKLKKRIQDNIHPPKVFTDSKTGAGCV